MLEYWSLLSLNYNASQELLSSNILNPSAKKVLPLPSPNTAPTPTLTPASLINDGAYWKTTLSNIDTEGKGHEARSWKLLQKVKHKLLLLPLAKD